MGDLEELYSADLSDHGSRRANWLYAINALAFLRYHRLRKRQFSKTQNHMSLVKNYFKVSTRDLIRNKTYTFTNLIGLVSGLTIALLIFQYVLFETGFDRFHQNADRMYRVVNDRYQNGQLVQHGTITYPTIGPTMLKDFPEVEAFTRMTYSSRNYVDFGGVLHLTNQFLIADENFLNFFSFPLIQGDPQSALEGPHKVVLSAAFAKRLLTAGSEPTEMVGKSISVYGATLKVSGIVEDVPSQSHLQFDMLISYDTFISLAGEGADNSWQWSDFYHYVRLKDGVDVANMSEKLVDFGERYFKKGEVSGGEEKFFLQPLLAAHFNNTMEYEIGQVINGEMVWVMLIVAFFVLVIAWINYINLTSSRSLQRAREIGIRKSVGAVKTDIIRQFIVETFLMNFVSLVVSFLFVFLLQPYFNEITTLDLGFSIFFSTTFFGIPFIAFFLTGWFIVSVILSIYPALLVSKFQAKDIAHGKLKVTGDIKWLRKGLVIFQFFTAVVLVNATMAISDQIDFMISQDPGVDLENTMVLYGPALTSWDTTFISKFDLFKSEVSNIPGVLRASTSSRVAGNQTGRIFQVRSETNPEAKDLTFNFINVDHDFTEVFGLEVLAGRDFEITDHDYDPANIRNIVVNESALKLLRISSPSEAIGQTVSFWNRNWTIIGVVNDFHQLSLHTAIEPLTLLPYYNTSNDFSIKLDGPGSESTLAQIQAVYDRIFPGNYFDYYFLEDQYRRQYNSEERLSEIGRIFTVLSIIVVILGLYGLMMMSIDKRVKEIGIRKVLGARMQQLIVLLSKDYMLLLGTAIFIGIPFSLWAIGSWKDTFAYRASLDFQLLLFSVLLVCVSSCIPLIFHLRKIALNNPVNSLRNE